MKTTWVLTEEERRLKFQGKGGRKYLSNVTRDCQENDAINISGDLAKINIYVAASDYNEESKVNDMDTELIRKIIR